MKKLILILILLFSVFLYFYKLDKIPNGFYIDEATVAYNAYSISQTAKDEYGMSMPVYFRLIGSYTPAGFVYLASLFVKVLGYSPIVFRSISAISMLVSIYLVYLLAKKLKVFSLQITYFLVVFFYAISPWIVFNARLGYETTLGFVVFSLGAYFLYISLEKPKNFIWAILSLSLSTYISHSQRFAAPMLLIVFFILFSKQLVKIQNKKTLIAALTIGLISQIPNLLLMTTPSFWVKNGLFEFNLQNWLVYLSPKTLFFQNPDINLQHVLPKLSVMYDWMVVPYLIGFYILIKGLKKTGFKFIAIYALTSLAPAVFSGSFYSEQRSLSFAVPLILIIGLGLDQIFVHLNAKMVVLISSFFAFYSLVILYGSYFVLFPQENAQQWNWGYDLVAEYIKHNSDKTFLVDNTRNPGMYPLFLYYLKVDPMIYQNSQIFYKDNYYYAPPMASTYKFANVEVRPIVWEEDINKNLIIIGDPLTVSEGQAREHHLDQVNQIKDTFGNTIFKFYKTNPISLQTKSH